MSPDKLVDENDPSTSWHVGCHDKGGPGKIHEVILVINMKYRVIPLLLGLLAISLVLTQAINPGIRLRVTDKTLQYVSLLTLGLQNNM